MKILSFLLAVASLALFSCVSPPKRVFLLDQTPLDTAKTHRFDVAGYQKKYDGYDGVFLSSENLVEHTANDIDWIAYRVASRRYMILNPDAEWLTTLEIDVEEDQELLGAFVNVVSPEGKVRVYSKEDMKVERNSYGQTVYRFAYPDVRVGTVIDEGYEIKYNNGNDLIRDEFPLQYSIPCEYISVMYAFPKLFWVSVKRIGPDKYPAVTADKEGSAEANVITYEGKNVPPISDEPYSPYFKEMSNYIDLAITGVNTVAFIKSWHEYADLFRSYALHRESIWTDKAAGLLKEIITPDMSDMRKMETIVSWLQENVRIESVPENFSFNQVIAEKKGTPMMVTGLGRLMLQKEGIDADFILIHSAEDGYFDDNYLTYGVLAIPAIHTKLDGKDFFLFPYRKRYPVDLVPEYVQGQRAIRVNEDGFNGFITVPYGNPARNTTVESYELNIDEEGAIRVTEEKELRGSLAYAVRILLAETTDEEMEDVMKGLLAYDEGDVELENYELENREDYRKPLTIRLRYTIDNLVTVTPDEVIFQTAGLLSPSSNSSAKYDEKKRQNPIRIYNDEGLERNIRISYPGSWRLASVPENVSYANGFGKVEAEYIVGEGRLEVKMNRTLHQANEPPEKFGELLDIIGRRSRHLNVPTLVFAQESGG